MGKDVITLDELYEGNFEITDLFAIRQKWTKDILFKMDSPRKSTGLILLKSCDGIYTDKKGESFFAKEKSVVCLPYLSEYTVLNHNCTNTFSDAILIEFNITKGNKTFTLSEKPFLISDVNFLLATELFENAVEAYCSAVASPMELKKSVLELLILICKNKKDSAERFSIIGEGIRLLESNPLSDITIEEIARSCNVTPCYFRRLFKEYAGKTPTEYRMEFKMNTAKRMLESGEFKVEHIAETLGFESASYFCRMFKKRFKLTPIEYKNSSKENFNV